MTLENSGPSLRQCKYCLRWFERATFPLKSARCKECLLARARELSRTPEQVQKRKERRANHTPEQSETERDRGRRKYANRTLEQKQRDSERRQSRREIDNARSRKLRAQSPERRAKQGVSVWKSTLNLKYRITPDIYHAMDDDQGGKCYFCDERPSRGKGRLAVDHDKKTGFVRGLLCRPCNAGWVDEYKKLPKEFRDSPRTNVYLRRGETGDYVESVRQCLASRRPHPLSERSGTPAG